ncbi:MAG: hypothetical protein RIA69_00435 [Cyclobacteriaceae bacterium]
MSIQFKDILIILSLWLVVQSCDPCDECGTSLELNPSVNLIFINQGGLIEVEKAIDSTNLIIDSLDNRQSIFIDTISYWNDSIDQVQIAIDSGSLELTEYLEELNLLVDLFADTLSSNREVLNQYDSIEGVLVAVSREISSGLIKPEKITLVNNALVFEYEDSANFFTLPLILKENFTRYEIIIEDEIFYIEMTYETAEEINLERKVIVTATNIIPTSDTFDSLTVDCNNRLECLNNETDITLYF